MTEQRNTINSADCERDLVLVVDDEQDFCKLMTDWLSAEDIHCLCAPSVEEAIAVLKNKQIALTLLDWGLNKSAAEVLQFCRERYPLMPVIVMSGMPFDVRTDAIVKQADGFLDKTLLSSTLIVSHVAHWLRRLKNTPKAFLPQRPQDILPFDQVKRIYFRHAVQSANGNIRVAAERLGVHRQTVADALKNEDPGNLEPI